MMNPAPYAYFALKGIKAKLREERDSLKASIDKEKNDYMKFKNSVFSTIKQELINDQSKGFVKI